MPSPRKRVVLYSPQLASDTAPIPASADVLPLSVLTIAAWPVADGYDVVLIDGNLRSQEEAHRTVLEACEGAVIYGTTGILGYQVTDALLCSQKVRARFPELRMVVGGWFASVAPELQLANGIYDAVCLGQGELAFRELVRAADAGEPFDEISGLALLRDGEVVRTAPRPVAGWDELLECPWRLIDFDEYRRRQLTQGADRLIERAPRPRSIPAPENYTSIAYFSSFGCPESCAFCCSPGVTGRRWKAMPAERMLDDMQALHERWGYEVVRFYDASWGISEERMRTFAEGMLERGLPFQYYVMIQGDSVLRAAPETLDLLARSGLYGANIGAETGSEEFARVIGKRRIGEDNCLAARELDRRGVTTWVTFQIGYPDEPAESMLATIDQARRIHVDCEYSHPAVWTYCPIPGTPMYERALELGFEAPRTLPEWGEFVEYHPAGSFAERIPLEVRRRLKLYQHYTALSRGTARRRIGWWERRARRRLASGSFAFGRLEAKAFDVVQRAKRLFSPNGRRSDS